VDAVEYVMAVQDEVGKDIRDSAFAALAPRLPTSHW
jgi:hypothetical protein